jgi:hypothetical protein
MKLFPRVAAVRAGIPFRKKRDSRRAGAWKRGKEKTSSNILITVA